MFANLTPTANHNSSHSYSLSVPEKYIQTYNLKKITLVLVQWIKISIFIKHKKKLTKKY